MSEPDFENLPTRLGVYTLTELLGHDALTDLYLARQRHVERGVVVQVLRPGADKAATDYFLKTVRTRGLVTLPGISHVLESKNVGNVWFLTHERPGGHNLAQMAAAEERLGSAQTCAVIETVARMYAAAEEKNIAMEGLEPHSIYVRDDNTVRVLSPVICGEHNPETAVAHMQALAAAIRLVQPINVPGQGRVATLLQWMEQGYDGHYLSWSAISTTAEQIRTQTAPLLNPDAVENIGTDSVGRRVRLKQAMRRQRRRLLALLGAALFVVLMGVAGAMLSPDAVEPLPAVSGRYLYVKAEQGERRVMLRPVTIREYQRFLNVYEDPSATNQFRRAAINKGVPADFTSHTPAEWQQQLQAVDSGEPWHGNRLTPRSPVCGVSYWDALAYANFQGGELPSAAVVATAREHAAGNNSLPEEWSTTVRQGDMLYAEGVEVLPATGCNWSIVEPNKAARNVNRGFRILLPVPVAE